MSEKLFAPSASKGASLLTIAFLGPAFLWAGCATAPEPEVSSHDIQTVQERVEDVERTNGRLMVRVEEMERQVSLMQDRVESNRIALQRHGYLGNNRGRFARAPQQSEDNHQDERPEPAPESHYTQSQRRGDTQSQRRGDYQVDPSMRQRIERRGGTHIPLSDQQSGKRDRSQQHESQYHDSDDDSHRDQQRDQSRSGDGARDDEQTALVITNEELESRYGPSRSTRRDASQPSPSTSESSRSGSAHPPVTDERLPTSEELEESSAEEGTQRPDSSLAGASDKELLEVYQDSLSQYRAGDYAAALSGFQSFLEAGPRDDYVDNALYWIGECHYGLRDYQSSITKFQRILDELPNGNKVPDAMLKMSMAYDQLGEPDRSLELLHTLIERYPNSNPGRLGAERLEEHPEYDG